MSSVQSNPAEREVPFCEHSVCIIDDHDVQISGCECTTTSKAQLEGNVCSIFPTRNVKDRTTLLVGMP